MSEKGKTKSPANFDFLLDPSVQFENRVSPTDEAMQRFSMEDINHRHVTGKDVWAVYRSPAFRKKRASKARALLTAEASLQAPELTHG